MSYYSRYKYVFLIFNFNLIKTAQKFKSTISEWYQDVDTTATVVAHEIAHVLGISHDYGNYDVKRYKKGTNIDCHSDKTVMGFGRSDDGNRSQIDTFSACSREDFAKWFSNQVDGSACLASSKLILLTVILFIIIYYLFK